MMKTEELVDHYIRHLHGLYEDVESWLKEREAGAKISRRDVDILEYHSGAYRAPELHILRADGKSEVTLKPAGRWILGAVGKVELIGRLGSHVLLLIAPGEPWLSLSVGVEGGAGKDRIESQRVTPGERSDDLKWAWMKEQIPLELPLLDADLFFKLVDDVTR
jgi:hypothetical protein